MNGLALYLASMGASNIRELADDFDIPIEAIEERLLAAKLCFEKQVAALELLAEEW